MKYLVALAARAICEPQIMREMPFIPNTEQTQEFDTNSGVGKDIWHGYLKMRQEQKTNPLPEGDWRKIRVPEDADPANEIHKFREAITIFFRFLAGEGRDNCLAVKDIKLIA